MADNKLDNALLIAANMLQTNNPISITQNPTDGKITLSLQANDSHFAVINGKLDASKILEVIAANASDVTLRLNTQSGLIAGNTTAIAANGSAIAANTSAIAANASAIEANASAIEANESAIEANASAIAANATNVQANASAIAANESAIGALTSRVDAHDTAIDVIEGQIDALTSGSIDLSNYTTDNRIYMKTTNDAGFAVEASTLTVNGNSVLTAADKGVADGVVPLNADGKIDRGYLQTIDIQEVYTAVIAADGTITSVTDSANAAVAVSDIQLGDAIITADGDYYYRTKVETGTIADFAKFTRDLDKATTAEINAGTDDSKFITAAALKGSAPEISGANISAATSDTKGAVKVSEGNGLVYANDTISVSVATADAYGTVKVTEGNGLALTAGVISLSAATADALGTVKVSAGNGLTYNDNVIAVGLATANAAGTVKLSGKGIVAGTDGSFDIEVATDGVTISGDGTDAPLAVVAKAKGAISLEGGLGVNVGENLVISDENKIELGEDVVLVDDIAGFQVKQGRIPVEAGVNYDSSANTITFDAVEFPKGIRNTDNGTFFAMAPTVGEEGADGKTSYTFVLGSLTILANDSWEIVF